MPRRSSSSIVPSPAPSPDAERPDQDWLDAAAAIAARGRPLSRPNPAVGAVIVRDGRVVGRGWTQPGGRPHAEAMALAEAGTAARGATLYVTLEPCAHASARGPSCTSLVLASGLARVVIGCEDPDPRTAGNGIALLRQAGIAVEVLPSAAAQASLDGYLARSRLGRPHVTLKLATSLDGRIALADGTSQWITGPQARALAHGPGLQRDLRGRAAVADHHAGRADAAGTDVERLLRVARANADAAVGRDPHPRQQSGRVRHVLGREDEPRRAQAVVAQNRLQAVSTFLKPMP